MSDAQFPERTAGDLTLPNGDVVWVCTLNSRLRDEASRKASWHAQKETRAFLKGGADYGDVLAQMKALTIEQQAAYIVQREYAGFVREVADKMPLPEKPEQGALAAEVFTQSVVEWETAVRKVEEKRRKAEDSRYAAEVKKNAALAARVRIDRCCAAFFAERWAEAFTPRWVGEVIVRATRHADDHDRPYFGSAEAYELADDGVQSALDAFYFQTLDTVKSEEVPTSPAAS